MPRSIGAFSQVLEPLDRHDMRRIVERHGANAHGRPAREIAALYKARWRIELLFEWIKRNLRVRRLPGRGDNAVNWMKVEDE